MAIDCSLFPLEEEKLNEIENLYNRQVSLVNEHPEDNLGFAELDKDFHCAIASACDNESLYEFIQSINNVMIRINVLSGTLARNRQDALNEHAEIIKYLNSGQKEFAKLALSEHLKHVEERMLTRENIEKTK